MIDVAAFPVNYFGNLFLVFVRVGALLFTAPLLSGRTVPQTLKVGLAILVTIILLPLQGNLPEVPFEWLPLSLLVLKELGLGVMVGFVSNLVFNALQLAGQFIGLQMGFTLANVIDPLFSQSVSLLDQLYTILAGLVFFAVDGHHMIILGLQQSFELVPLGGMQLTAAVMDQLIRLTAGMFVVALRLVLPIMASLLLADVALGLMARTVPQMNIFVVGLPVKIGLGFIVLIATLPAVNSAIGGLLRSSSVDISNLLRMVAG